MAGKTATSLEVGLLQLLLYVSWCDTLSRFWSFLPGLLSAFVAAIVSTEKMTNVLRKSNLNHISHLM